MAHSGHKTNLNPPNLTVENPISSERGGPGHIRDREGGGVADLHVPQVSPQGNAQAEFRVEQEVERLHHPRPDQRLNPHDDDERVQGRQGGPQRVAGEPQDQGILGERI